MTHFLSTPTQTPVLVNCGCGRANCTSAFWLTRRGLELARHNGRVLVAHHHADGLDEIVGVADHYLVVQGRR